MVILSGIWPRWWCLRRAGCWPRGTGTDLTGWLILLGRWLRPLRSTSGICWRRRRRRRIRSYGLDLLRWFRFLWAGSGAPGIGRRESRPAIQPVDAGGWQAVPAALAHGAAAGTAAPAGAPEAYAPSVRAHCETVLRSFYDFHRDAGSGPVINPFPLDRRGVAGGRTRTTTRCCDVRSHVMSEYVEGSLADVRDVIRASVQGPSLP